MDGLGQRMCQYCGAALGTGQAYCSACGAIQAPASTAGYYGSVSALQAPRRSAGATVGCVVAGVLLLILGGGLFLVLAALPNFIKIKDKAKEAEVKQNLHMVQLGVERFAVDNDGDYPPYLIGGSAKHAAQLSGSTDERQAANFFKDVHDAPDPKQVADPLLRAGYLNAYPANPFTRNGPAIHALQASGTFPRYGSDPLRNGAPTAQYGTRFGPDCTLMGSVLADPRYVKWREASGKAGLDGELHTYADIEYDFWDMWAGDKPGPFLPGQFWYKSAGVFKDSDAKTAEKVPWAPEHSSEYSLGAYGSVRTKGEDLLGEEKQFHFMPKERGGTDAIWTWTRSVIAPGTKAGSPYGDWIDSDNEYFRQGNANGVRDGAIILLESADGDYRR